MAPISRHQQTTPNVASLHRMWNRYRSVFCIEADAEEGEGEGERERVKERQRDREKERKRERERGWQRVQLLDWPSNSDRRQLV